MSQNNNIICKFKDIQSKLDSIEEQLKQALTLKTINGESILGSGNIDIQSSVVANEAYPASWFEDTNTMEDLIGKINADNNAVPGKIYLNTISLNDLPAGMVQAEVKAEIMAENPRDGKVILFTVTSSNTAPYHWEYTSAWRATGTWRAFQMN